MANPSEQSLELQSLRGIAAAIVMIHHALRVFDEGSSRVAWTVSEVVFNAHAAVIVFFVLSGYVLSRSLLMRGITGRSVAEFYVRRGFRIYPALWVGVGLGTLYFLLVWQLPAEGLASWVALKYRVNDLTFWNSVGTLIGADTFLLPTLWTITVELVASLFIPFMLLVVLRGSRATLLLLLGLALLSYVGGTHFRLVPLYLLHFAMGVALAAVPALARFNPGWLGTLVAAIVLLFLEGIRTWGYPSSFTVLINGLAAMIVVAGLLHNNAAWMRHGVLNHLGNWSYGVYLLHLPIAFMIARTLLGSGVIASPSSVWSLLVVAVTALITIPLSAIVYTYVELPGIAAGQACIRWARSTRPNRPSSSK